MPKIGDSYTVELKSAHINWGSHRHTNSRGTVYSEGYIHIPASEARRLELYNSNNIGANILYTASSRDGFLENITLRASGSSSKGGIFAKQFQGQGNLKLVGSWYNHIGVSIGALIRLTWVSDTHIILEQLPQT